MANLEGRTVELVTILHNKGAHELADPDTFLDGFRDQFRDPAQTEWAEVVVWKVKQGSRPVAKYIREFRKIAGRLRHWPEQMLTQYFQKELSSNLFHMCLVRRRLNRLSDRY